MRRRHQLTVRETDTVPDDVDEEIAPHERGPTATLPSVSPHVQLLQLGPRLVLDIRHVDRVRSPRNIFFELRVTSSHLYSVILAIPATLEQDVTVLELADNLDKGGDGRKPLALCFESRRELHCFHIRCREILESSDALSEHAVSIQKRHTYLEVARAVAHNTDPPCCSLARLAPPCESNAFDLLVAALARPMSEISGEALTAEAGRTSAMGEVVLVGCDGVVAHYGDACKTAGVLCETRDWRLSRDQVEEKDHCKGGGG
jgi:hypothetical protein